VNSIDDLPEIEHGNEKAIDEISSKIHEIMKVGGKNLRNCSRKANVTDNPYRKKMEINEVAGERP